VQAFGDEARQPLLRLRNGVRTRDADRVKALLARCALKLAL
jgi:hypothetical protein